MKKGDFVEKRADKKGRRSTDEFCLMHESIVNSQQEIKSGFKWLIGLHIGEYGIIISALIAAVIFLAKSKGG